MSVLSLSQNQMHATTHLSDQSGFVHKILQTCQSSRVVEFQTSSGATVCRPLNMALKRLGAGALRSVLMVVVCLKPPTFRVTCSEALAATCRIIRSESWEVAHSRLPYPRVLSQYSQCHSHVTPLEKRGGVEAEHLGQPSLLLLKLLAPLVQRLSLLRQHLPLPIHAG